MAEVKKWKMRTLALLCLAGALAAQAPLPPGPGRDILSAACASCHAISIVTAKARTEAEWTTLVNAMIDRGARLTKEQNSAVIAYLTRHFGPLEKGKELVENVCILCHELDRVKAQRYSRDQWAGEIKGMLAEGAPVTGEEFDLIVSYLASAYGPAR